MTVKAWLRGHDFDLQDLADLFPTGDTRVVRDGDGYYLTSIEIDHAPEGVPFYEIAQVVLQRVNGLGRAKNPSFRPVTVSGRYQDEDQTHHVVSADSIEVRSRVSAVAVVMNSDGVRVRQPPPVGPQHASLAATNNEVAEALIIMGQGVRLGWAEMYKVYEIVRDNARPSTIADVGWASSAECKAFGAAANRPDVSGPNARHARMSGGPPQHRMTEEEGRHFISKIVTAWLGSLA